MEERNLRKTRTGKVVSDKMDKTIVVAVEAIIGIITSVAPFSDASILSCPNSVKCLKILSKTTIELSTNIPTPKDNPIKDIIFNVIPLAPKNPNVAIIETGIATVTTKVALQSLKKINSIIVI